MKHESPEEFFNRLSNEEQREIEQWKVRRECLLRKLVEGELEAAFEEHDSAFVPSTPFLRVLVRSASTCRESGKAVDLNEEAFLTIWSPCDDQIDVIKEGTHIKATNLNVKDERFDGRIQLNASNRTSIVALPKQKTTTVIRDGFRPVTSIAKAQLISKRNSKAARDVDVAGVILRVERSTDSYRKYLYLTDPSGLILRIQWGVGQHNAHSLMPLLTPQTSAGAPSRSAWRLCYLQMLGFDHGENCPIAEFTHNSSVIDDVRCPHARALTRWTRTEEGEMLIRKTEAFTETCLPRTISRELHNISAIGFIAGYHLHNPTHELFLRVDCGGNDCQTWKLNLSNLLPSLSESLWDSNGLVALDSESEQTLANLQRLEEFFRARHKRYCFHLIPLSNPASIPDCKYEVSKITCVKTESLVSMFLLALEQTPT